MKNINTTHSRCSLYGYGYLINDPECDMCKEATNCRDETIDQELRTLIKEVPTALKQENKTPIKISVENVDKEVKIIIYLDYEWLKKKLNRGSS